ncbi:hypothetical protein C1M51_18375 [Methylibium sp. Pch-M]|uniref:hypothetical protein n=1 Tax=Methylibium sp. Pch-M TaxID=2082386 RepID=UPI00101312FE|nr:hypothetical protein [Methylibium sp. Pch-M]QAZ41226.1 hypothetical protein C1M51_18375 [Methylibium sp. Pch-M]
MDIELLTITLSANESKRFERAGRRIDVIDAAYPIAELALTDTNGGAAGFLRNVDVGIFARLGYASFSITNGATAQTVRVLVTDGDGGSNKQPGVVRVVDQGSEKTIAGAQYFGSSTRPAAGGVVGLAGLLAGTRPLALKRVQLGSATAGELTLWAGTAAPASGPVSLSLRNKLLAAVATVPQRATGTATTITPSGAELPGGISYAGLYVPANGIAELPLTTPIVIPAGTWFGAVGSAVNTDVKFIFDVEEL